VGDLIANKYRLVRELGMGGMGMVFEAEHIRLRQRFAIKMLHPSTQQDPTFATRFEREARAAVQLTSPYVARVFDVDVTTSDNIHYMVMELLRGHDLSREFSNRGQLSQADAASFVAQACLAMVEAHDLGIIHRDLKPSNLFLHDDGDKKCIKVLDFGISKILDDQEAQLTFTSQVLGTPMFMSPEQVQRPRSVDYRTDIWSLGVILYRALAGKPPFSGETAHAVAITVCTQDPPPLESYRSGLPEELLITVRSAMQRDSAKRCPSAAALYQRLAPFASLPFQPSSRIQELSERASESILPPPDPAIPIEVDSQTISDSTLFAKTEDSAITTEATGDSKNPLSRRSSMWAATIAVVAGMATIATVVMVLKPPSTKAPTTSLASQASSPIIPAKSSTDVPPAEPTSASASATASNTPTIAPTTSTSAKASVNPIPTYVKPAHVVPTKVPPAVPTATHQDPPPAGGKKTIPKYLQP
jgi:eukaryotic-like serine/threonine-protein kinase